LVVALRGRVPATVKTLPMGRLEHEHVLVFLLRGLLQELLEELPELPEFRSLSFQHIRSDLAEL